MLVDPVEGCGVISMDITTRPIPRYGSRWGSPHTQKSKNLHKLTTFFLSWSGGSEKLPPGLQLSPLFWDCWGYILGSPMRTSPSIHMRSTSREIWAESSAGMWVRQLRKQHKPTGSLPIHFIVNESPSLSVIASSMAIMAYSFPISHQHCRLLQVHQVSNPLQLPSCQAGGQMLEGAIDARAFNTVRSSGKSLVIKSSTPDVLKGECPLLKNGGMGMLGTKRGWDDWNRWEVWETSFHCFVLGSKLKILKATNFSSWVRIDGSTVFGAPSSPLMRPLVSEHSTGLGVSLPTCHGYPRGRCLQRWFGVHHHHVQGRVWLGESSSGLDSLVSCGRS